MKGVACAALVGLVSGTMPAAVALAGTFVGPSLITGINLDLGGNYLYLRTDNNQNPGGACVSSVYLVMDMNATRSKELYAALLSAYLSGSQVSLNYDGCQGNYPKITSVALPTIW